MNKKIIQRISLLILLFVLPIAYPVTDIHAQDVRVTIRMEKVRMEQVMNEIERQTKYLFGSAENVDVKRIVTVQVVNRPLQEALDAMLRGTNVSYTVQGSNIVLKNGRSEAEAKKPAVISGVVRDAAGNPVVGAAVVGIVVLVSGAFVTAELLSSCDLVLSDAFVSLLFSSDSSPSCDFSTFPISFVSSSVSNSGIAFYISTTVSIPSNFVLHPVNHVHTQNTPIKL